MPSLRTTRAILAAAIVCSILVLAHGALTAPTTASPEDVPRPEPRDGVTVVTESAKYGTIIAWNPDGSLLYYEDEHTKYFDVDPVPNESLTVEYAASDTIHMSGSTCSDPPCARNYVERANLSTGEVEEIYARYDHKETAGEWHDHERIDDERILIADIVDDQVFLVNTTTELVEWRWDAQSDFPIEGGGQYPGDWAHINDVELLEDGRVMVSLRNQDQVVFLDPDEGLLEGWTLGSEDDYETLHEQHNPDYIPEARGGPAIIVADSENGRIVEYQRESGEWVRSWEWTDDTMQWPRDADRLLNGHTLISDTHGKRVIELDRNGEIVWEVPLVHPYEVERLNTGPESAGGESAARLDLESRDTDVAEDGNDPLAVVVGPIKAVVPSRLVNAAIYVGPVWMGRPQWIAAGLGLVAALAWLGVEIRHRLPPIGIRSPFYRGEE